jgi:hypothetical protein
MRQQAGDEIVLLPARDLAAQTAVTFLRPWDPRLGQRRHPRDV